MPAKAEEYARPAATPDTSSLVEMRDASRECTACHLYKRATQTVFGEGPKSAPIMLVGEQPGDMIGALFGPSPNTVCVARL
jgi:uracil-DNA glycosylase